MSAELMEKVIALVQSRETKKRDLRRIYLEPAVLNEVAEELAGHFCGKADYIMVPDSFGMILASRLSDKLGIGVLPLKKRHGDHVDEDDDIRAPYINHCDKPCLLMTRSGQIPKGSRLLLVDDWVETAATMQACVQVAEEMGCQVAGIAAVGANRNNLTAKLLDTGVLKTIVVR